VWPGERLQKCGRQSIKCSRGLWSTIVTIFSSVRSIAPDIAWRSQF